MGRECCLTTNGTVRGASPTVARAAAMDEEEKRGQLVPALLLGPVTSRLTAVGWLCRAHCCFRRQRGVNSDVRRRERFVARPVGWRARLMGTRGSPS